jgi:hypothetical protein
MECTTKIGLVAYIAQNLAKSLGQSESAEQLRVALKHIDQIATTISPVTSQIIG